MSQPSLAKRAVIEALGTAFLLATPVGCGVMADRLAAGNGALALLCCSLTTTGVLAALIIALGPLSGAHLNPVVTLTQSLDGELPRSEIVPYVFAQLAGAFVGVFIVHAMFELPLIQSGVSVRSGSGQVFGEFIATFGLVLLVTFCTRHRSPYTAFMVAGYIGAAYWFTSSTSFANPAGSIARAFTQTPAGIRLTDVPGFLLGEFTGMIAAFALARWLLPVAKKAS